MKRRNDKAPEARVRKVTFAWRSALAALGAMCYLLLLTDPGLSGYYGVPDTWLQPPMKWWVFGAFLAVVLLDLYRYRRQYARQAADLRRVDEQVRELWESKKQLQLKAHTYSGHADKLKLFISDKLLEHIEYDEKFLHFKSIAAEVRHNGVISFDKVQTALQQAAAAAEVSANTATAAKGGDAPAAADYQAALDAMRYLWDLLDLSTADNLALHIGNLLCECEEHYYQRLLNSDAAAPLPFEPVYAPQRAAWRALAQVSHAALPPPPDEGAYLRDDGQWHVRLDPVGELLGNENHLVLLLENLLKNAQYFSGKRGYKAGFTPIALTLAEEQGRVCLRVYNRGPHVADEDRPNLFQLGYSTRRPREHHGRGLGLYFVSEIVKGYEGHIAVHNIHTPETQYAVRVELANDEVITDLIDVVLVEGRPMCRAGSDTPAEAREWTFKAPLRSVEVTTTGSRNTQRLQAFDAKGKQLRFDPAHPERPRWRLEYAPKRNAHQLRFEAMDIGGVEFEIRLPTARLRLESSELAQEEDFEAEVERLDERLRAHAPFDPAV
ncbi:sensor histidine kinase [Ectothiorhodospiraceae bacterium 2226]|nr:sensor histidine kinase [Ectothiorhodospiraceae bacterium 2226]